MTAAALAERTLRRGLRQVQPRRDMGQIGELIETAFAGQLDSTGLRMVRDMRQLGRVGWLGWLLARMILQPFANPLGYVWEEHGRIVGNANLLPIERFPERWVLANVAVYDEYRRRGIAGSLVKAALDLAREIKAREVVLQVRSAQHGARSLYDKLGFHVYGTRNAWARAPFIGRPGAPEGHPIRLREPEEWHAQWGLARKLHPEGLVWPYPLTPATFRPSKLRPLFESRARQHWVWHEDGNLVASLSARYLRSHGRWRLVLMALPEARGMVEGPLLAAFLARIPRTDAAILDYAAGYAENEIRNLGFHSRDVFTWMGYPIA